jgi:hypothetical protein
MADTVTRRYLFRGLMCLFSGFGLMIFLYQGNSIMAHHWSAPRHWLGTSCHLESPILGDHPDGHELDEQILELERLNAPEEKLRRLRQEVRELRRFPAQVPLMALAPIAVGITYLVFSLRARGKPEAAPAPWLSS